MQIHIDLPRPMLTLSIVTALVVGGYVGQDYLRLKAMVAAGEVASTQTIEDPTRSADYDPLSAEGLGMGADTTSPSERTSLAENTIRNTRQLQELLARKAELLRYQVEVLRKEREAMGDNVTPEVEEEFRQSSINLSELIQDQRKAEEFLASSFDELFEAEGRATSLSQGYRGPMLTTFTLSWPVDHSLGISAYFRDAEYKERFGFEHDAIDIPVLQGSDVLSAADGTVKDVVDNGLGFNYITVQHDGGIVTLYGHLSELLVTPGQIVRAGELLGMSGGRPGTNGAGFSTGPHLHFGVTMNGEKVNPLDYLPSLTAPTVKAVNHDAKTQGITLTPIETDDEKGTSPDQE